MKMQREQSTTFVTLGPSGTCHERAVRAYAAFQDVRRFDVRFIEDFLVGLELIRGREDTFLVQCSAHPLVHVVTERYRGEIFVVDTFLFPTKSLAVLRKKQVGNPRTLGLVPATAGYIDERAWDQITDVVSKPLVARGLLEGRYEAGLTHLEYAESHPDELQVVEEIGEIDTTWIVYGTSRRFEGDLVGIPSPDLYPAAPRPSRPARSPLDRTQSHPDAPPEKSAHTSP